MGNETHRRRQRGARRGPKQKKSMGREIFEWVLCVAAAFIIAWLVHTFLGQLIIVRGTSMEPTLHNTERVLVSKISYLAGEPGRGDVAVVLYPGSKEHYIKRIVALGGDKISISNHTLYLNGVAQNEPYIAEPIAYTMDEVTVPEGTVFVMGDNRNHSSDSHMDSVGFIPVEWVLGKAMFTVWPFNTWRSLKLS